MAPTSSTEPMKRTALHHLLKQQHLLQQRLKPAVVWSWPAAPPTGRQAPDEATVDDDGLGGTWPPRSYTCAFCRREFRSAQALGGHMNVHRRDRAKMRAHGPAAQLGGAASAAEAPAAATVYPVLYPILNSNAAGAVPIPSGDVLLSAPVALATAHHDHQYHVSDDENDKDIDLELRLWWP